MGAVMSGNQEDVDHGAMEQMMGSVTSVSGNTFALSMMQGAQPITFQTASGTQFENMAGMGMMSGGMGMMTAAADKEMKKAMKRLTRTDFLLQFVWVTPKVGEEPQTKEDLEAKLKAEADKLTEAEKTYTADASAKAEEAIEAASLKKSQAVDRALDNAISAANPGGGAQAQPNAPGFVPAPGGAQGAAPPAAPGAAKGAQPPSN